MTAFGVAGSGGASGRRRDEREFRTRDSYEMATTKLDLTGLKCPLPALKTRKALKGLAPGDLLEVRCTDPLSVIDIPNLIRETGDKVEITEQAELGIVFLIEKTAGPSAVAPPS
jgi:tRNA 2-thiouridine synthesizing protein A